MTRGYRKQNQNTLTLEISPYLSPPSTIRNSKRTQFKCLSSDIAPPIICDIVKTDQSTNVAFYSYQIAIFFTVVDLFLALSFSSII